jgi:hypothetical protein
MCESIVRYCQYCGKITNTKPSRKKNGNKCNIVFCDRICYDKSRSEKHQARSYACIRCGKITLDPSKTLTDKKYCSSKCFNEDRKPDPIKCIQCGVIFSAVKFAKRGGVYKYCRISEQKTCTRKCLSDFFRSDKSRKLKIAKSITGSNHVNWQGGSHYGDKRGSGWLAIAEKCRELHGRVCKLCGKTEQENGRKLDVNHIIPFHQHKNKTKANHQSNLEALCKSCHTKTDWEYRKNNPIQICLDIFK